jgi:hypothetical protein
MRKFLLVAFVTILAVPNSWSGKTSDKIKEDADIAAITKLENDQVKADLAGDSGYYETNLADDFIHGTGRGTWYTKQTLLKDLRDKANNRVEKSEISNLKIHLYGTTGIAAYDQTYEGIVLGKHQQSKVINTDVFVKRQNRWIMVASHTSRVQ